MDPDVLREASKVTVCWSTEVVVVGAMPTWSRGPIDESQPMRVKKNIAEYSTGLLKGLCHIAH